MTIKRGLVLAKYGARAASTRQRFVQTRPYLKAANIHIDIHPLFDDAYLNTFFIQGHRKKWAILTSYLNRIADLFRTGNYDFIWVQYELFPYLPGVLERLIFLTRTPVIMDMDDAIFHQYDQHNNRLIRALLGQKLRPLLRHSAMAFCGNTYLADYARRDCAHTHIIPTTVDTTLYVPAQKQRSSNPPMLGWIGSPSTWNYCLPLHDIFAEFVHSQQASMLVVGAEHAANTHYPFEFRSWAESREVADIQEMDIGVMPLPDALWARGKCGYKLIQYMACGIPVIASPIGVNREIVEHGVNGFLASTPDEWRAAITQLLADPALGQHMGQAGRAKVQEHYSIQHYGLRIAALIQQL